jgi:hypothetical protein
MILGLALGSPLSEPDVTIYVTFFCGWHPVLYFDRTASTLNRGLVIDRLNPRIFFSLKMLECIRF